MLVDKESAILNSISISAIASFVAKIESKTEIAEIDHFSKKEKLPLIILGEGTNIIPREYVKAVIAHIDFKGINAKDVYLQAQAGEKWDDVVKFSVEHNLSGLEALSGIPGTCGAAPVQNIGSYGTEISNCLESVEVYDRKNKSFAILNNNECNFGYRNSLFKNFPERFVIVSINLKLSKEKPEMSKYKDMVEYFLEKNDVPNPKEIREAILNIRKNKLPAPAVTPNAGSYFLNPIVKGEKISAGKLIEGAGLRGAKIGPIQISSNNALILTNPNRAGFKEIAYAENFIIQKVFQKFGITLEREPRII
jgi:UDP-N-acetylmuramate dehydrogenase